MALTWKENATNQIEKGTVIFEAEEKVRYICLVLTGEVIVNGMGVQVVLGEGSFLGVTDLFMGRYLSTYTALEDTEIYVFPVENSSSITKILEQEQEYRGSMVYALVNYLAVLSEVKNRFQDCAASSYKFLKESNEICKGEAAKAEILFSPIQGLEGLQPYEEEFGIEQEKLNYYLDCADIPVDVVKNYFSYSVRMAQRHVTEVSGFIAQILIGCMELSQYLTDIFLFFVNDGEEYLFQKEADLAIQLEREEKNAEKIIQRLDQTIDLINDMEEMFIECSGIELSIDREQIEQIYMNVLIEGWIPFTEEDREEERKRLEEEEGKEKENVEELEQQEDIAIEQEEKLQEEEEIEEGEELQGEGEEFQQEDIKIPKEELEREKLQQMVQEVSGAMQQILNCAKLEKNKEDLLRIDVEDLVAAKDRQSQDSEMRQTKQEITSIFYDLYYAVFLYSQQNSLPLAAELFLNYGFLDERLLDEKQLEDLLRFHCEEDSSKEPCSIYTMREWLQLIYDDEKDPSRNEFEEDYKEILRKQKRMGKITERKEAELLRDKEKKIYFEINNMFQYNERLLNGQLSTFVPILYKEQMFRDMKKLILTKKKLNETVATLLTIDYSVFYREVLYSRPDLGINREYIVKQIMPDFILLPVVGNHVSMWQEITGRKRDSAGRFLLPRLTETLPMDLVTKLFGIFHWELCRTMQGGTWNDIKYRSLTSEYVDYLQFYKKNRELSQEKKEKLKLQIKKNKNNSKEIFLQDYEIWIKRESKGAIRLNKVARTIMTTYIPFAKPIRESLVNQPLFADTMGRYQREKAKRVHDLERRFQMLKKTQHELPEELINTLHYYRDL